jgi:hypothetical protein
MANNETFNTKLSFAPAMFFCVLQYDIDSVWMPIIYLFVYLSVCLSIYIQKYGVSAVVPFADRKFIITDFR